MRQRKLGNTGLTVSEIGMGTWELGGREWGDIGETDAVDLLRYAFESGVTYYDTADQYGGGRAERLLGEAFSALGNRVVIATKLGYELDSDGWISHGWEHPSFNVSPDYIRLAVEGSLTRLQAGRYRYLSIPLASTCRRVGRRFWDNGGTQNRG